MEDIVRDLDSIKSRVLSGEQITISSEETSEQLTEQVAKGGGIAFVGSVIAQIIIFVSHIILGRVLGSVSYGLYALGISVIRIATSIASLGLGQGVVRFCSMYLGQKDHAKVKGTVISALVISVISSLVSVGILIALSGMLAQRYFDEPSLTRIIRVLALSLPFYGIVDIAVSFTQSFRRIDYQQMQRIFAVLINLVIIVFVLALGLGLTGAVYGFLLSGILSAGMGFHFLWRIFPEVKSNIRPAFDQVGKVVRFSLPMMLVAMSHVLALRTDRIMLGMFLGAGEVGIYSAAVNFAVLVAFPYSAAVAIFMPIVSDIHNKGQHDQVKHLYNVVKRWTTYGTLVIILPLIAYCQSVLSLFGQEFKIGWIVLVVIMASRFIGVICGPTTALLIMSGRHNIQLLNGSLMTVSNIVLNYLLIPVLGISGAAVATTLSLMGMNIIQIVEIYCFFGFHPFDRKHLGLSGLTASSIVLAIVMNLLVIGMARFLLLILVIFPFFIYIYRDKTEGDVRIWLMMRNRIRGVDS